MTGTKRRGSAATVAAMIGLTGLVIGACGGDDDESVPAAGADDSTPADADGGASGDEADDVDAGGGAGGDEADDADADGGAGGGDAADAPAPSGDAGTLVFGDDTVELASARCFLQEQEAAAGGGKILFVAQGMGTMPDGQPVLVDVSRYDEDSQFVGDDIKVDIGDPFSGESVSWGGGGAIGTVTVDGSTVSADDLTFRNFDDMSELAGSVVINC